MMAEPKLPLLKSNILCSMHFNNFMTSTYEINNSLIIGISLFCQGPKQLVILDSVMTTFMFS